MEKFKVLLTTALLTLSLVLITPSAMADPKLKSYTNIDVSTCILVQAGFFTPFGRPPFENFGLCMEWKNHS